MIYIPLNSYPEVNNDILVIYENCFRKYSRLLVYYYAINDYWHLTPSESIKFDEIRV